MPQQGVSNAVKQKLISEYIKTPAGRAKLAASLTQPLRTRRDYTSVGRKTFLVEQLPDGALQSSDVQLMTPKLIVASRLSIQPETFSRILKRLRSLGLIDVDGAHIVLRDVEGLRHLVEQ